jgi:hypothetical protein
MQSKVAMLSVMKKKPVEDWFSFLKRQQFRSEGSTPTMSLAQLAAKLSGGGKDGRRR